MITPHAFRHPENGALGLVFRDEGARRPDDQVMP